MNSALSTEHARNPLLPSGMMRAGDFCGGDYHFVGVRMPPDEPVLAGRVFRLGAQEGLEVHCTQNCDLRDLRSRVSAAPGLRVTVLLAGNVDVSFGARHVDLAAGRQQPCPRGMMVGTTHLETFERRWQRGKHERKVSLFLSSDWLQRQGLGDAETDPGVRDFLGRHLAVQPWQPSPRAVALAEQLLQLTAGPAPVGRLLISSRAIELAHEALSNLAGQGGHTSLPPREHQRLARLREFLSSDEALDLSLDDIARWAGLSASALQRHFRAAYGTSIAEFRRDARLHKARIDLEQRGLSVAQAAYAAGYNSAANFATAFKRRFGLSPKLVRARI
ncbi:helix-turn-helix transcriptional regulator [Pseudothauera nasutitermitis]|uniref:Helix-turn-helix transcriptional regulator n=1 Tax=Pseudothauera nasutitermitis TaxID=2565930 RepID=A0A4S4AZ55_9RHOO|nr:AraC family transcriptional regulator [Pseudothauera nasutitermitis]THF65423.1 helix-turn-helix transcriptional regulator [Pseudothauera nasutitermitis]